MALFKRKIGLPKLSTDTIGTDIEDRPFTVDQGAAPCHDSTSDVEKVETPTPKGQTPSGRSNGRPPNRQVVFLWSIGFIIILVWVFILGIIVGRGAIFNNHYFQELVDRITGVPPKRPVPIVELANEPMLKPPPATDVEPKLTFYDSLVKNPTKEPQGAKQPDKSSDSPKNKTSESVPKSKTPPESGSKPHESDRSKPVDLPTKSKTGDVERPKTVEPATKPKAPEPTAKAQPAPASVPASETNQKPRTKSDSASPAKVSVEPNVSGDPAKPQAPVRRPGENFAIQVVTTSASEEAAKVTASLKAKGFDAYYYLVEIGGKKQYRVRVGHYRTREEAKATLDKLSAAGQKNMFISALTD